MDVLPSNGPIYSLLPAALSCTDDGGYQPPKHMSAMVINVGGSARGLHNTPEAARPEPAPSRRSLHSSSEAAQRGEGRFN